MRCTSPVSMVTPQCKLVSGGGAKETLPGERNVFTFFYQGYSQTTIYNIIKLKLSTIVENISCKKQNSRTSETVFITSFVLIG